MGKNKRDFSLNAKNLASANLGQKIRFYRQIAGMTQKELGAACGVNESTIRNYELGNRYPDSDTIFEISNALEISPYVLATPDPISAASSLQYLFSMEKTLDLTPTTIDGKVYLEVSSEIDVNDATVAPLSNLKRMFSHWATMYEKFINEEIDEETYLLWQAKYLSFGTDSADFLLDAENEKAIEVDKNISDAKKRFRKANLKD
ncbi:helix-turn-helix transcriptional regulator [Eubacterium sp. AF19-12LB]|jgi:transcriptional regulator with XRE-family HTH domain|uniref:helix-turn-helix domain-containing protein n=1 Tax=Eubacterium sp. AF19-12LB TaxID=2293106 RepID=UPI000E543596|nr:helix-turn-helix transcriptional regulator [Eubacterium sp. AF19-12LB]RHR36947.1 XRE family transcriptional regulator [Eubacterium sp. AF19-12LB]